MKAYESPRIRIFHCEMTSHLQSTGTPGDTLIPLDCNFGQDCEQLGQISACITDPIDPLNGGLRVNFLFVGSTNSLDIPVCTITYDGVDYTSCGIAQAALCPEGMYWHASCLGVPCTTTNPVTIQCDGAEQQGSCEAVEII